VLLAVVPFLLPAEPIRSVDDYVGFGGGQGLARARELGPEQTIQEISLSGLRGRGGAGFPTGRKWQTVRRARGTTKYVVVNAAEGEPGTFKDRTLMRRNPYQIVEGAAIAALTLGAARAYICLKASFEPEITRMTEAVEEMQVAGLAGNTTIAIVTGPEEYLFGEEKAMLEVIEGNAPLPRLLPPFEHGLFAVAPQLGWQAAGADPDAPRGEPAARGQSNPTLVNNAETLATVPPVLARGAEWHRAMGTAHSAGHVICTVVGDVTRAGAAEIEMGTSLGDVIDEIGGGLPAGRRVKAVFSGVANAAVTGTQLDTPISYEGMQAAGSGLGSAGFIVYDESACMVDVADTFSRFLWVESCGQCEACKLGCEDITAALERIETGAGADIDVQEIGARLLKVTDGNRCALPVEEQIVIASILRTYPEEFADHLEGRLCTRRHDLTLPKIVDLVDGVAHFDEHQRFKQADWTYAGIPGGRSPQR
jgi:NADH:ubiquinone oxidoreductase subunit F (NADH-binding)